MNPRNIYQLTVNITIRKDNTFTQMSLDPARKDHQSTLKMKFKLRLNSWRRIINCLFLRILLVRIITNTGIMLIEVMSGLNFKALIEKRFKISESRIKN